MNVTPEVLEWVRKAEDDLLAASRLAEGDQPLPDQIGFFCQQAGVFQFQAKLPAGGARLKPNAAKK